MAAAAVFLAPLPPPSLHRSSAAVSFSNVVYGVRFRATQEARHGCCSSSSSMMRSCGIQELSRSYQSYGLSTRALRKNYALRTATRRNVVVCARGGPPRTGKKAGANKAGRGGGRSSRGIQKKNRPEDVDVDDDTAAEAALAALFSQLENDLESESDDDDDEEFSEEEIAAFEKDLEALFMEVDMDSDSEGEEEIDEEESVPAGEPGLVDMVMKDGIYGQADGVIQGDIKGSHEEMDDEAEEEWDYDEEEDDEEDEEEQRTVPLERWQLRKLAVAARQGRRNVNVKSLSAELGMDRMDVLSFLRDPPPELLLMGDSLDNSDEGSSESLTPSKPVEGSGKKQPQKVVTPEKKPMSKPVTAGGPQGPRSWHNNKRLRKEHIATFERVYRQSHRPSNAMIQNLVLLTHIPRKKVLEWFDNRRLQGAPKTSSFEDAPEL